MNLTADGAADALPLPVHLRERNIMVEFVSSDTPGWAYFSTPQYAWSDQFKKLLNVYSADELWSALTPAQQQVVTMFSILSPPFDGRRFSEVRICSDGDIEIELTRAQVSALKRIRIPPKAETRSTGATGQAEAEQSDNELNS